MAEDIEYRPEPFRGAKVILFLGERVLFIRRDPKPEIPWPGYLDFPGGGREGEETPEACAIRETGEETGLHLSSDAFVWKRARQGPSGLAWFFAAHLPVTSADEVQLGDEGSEWLLLAPEDAVRRPDVVPHFRRYLADYLSEVAGQ